MLFSDKTIAFIERAKHVHNDYYDYSNVEYINAKTKISIICPEHGVFSQTPDSHRRGSGCPKCGDLRSSKKQANSIQTVLDKFKSIHGNYYDYSRVKYINNFTPVEIICPIHGIFHLTPHKHADGRRGCQKCGRIKGINNASKTRKGLKSKKRLPIEIFLKRAITKHNGFYDYSLIKEDYEHSASKVKIICPNHGIFTQCASKHMQGRGCPNCRKSRQFSQISHQWLKSLDKDLILEYRLPNKKVRIVDGYDPLTNTVYQFHGDFWHGNPDKFNSHEFNTRLKRTYGELYQDTLSKDKEILDLGYNLIVMWESDWKKLSHKSHSK